MTSLLHVKMSMKTIQIQLAISALFCYVRHRRQEERNCLQVFECSCMCGSMLFHENSWFFLDSLWRGVLFSTTPTCIDSFTQSSTHKKNCLINYYYFYELLCFFFICFCYRFRFAIWFWFSMQSRQPVKKKEISFALHSLRANVLVFHFFLLTTYDLNAY